MAVKPAVADMLHYDSVTLRSMDPYGELATQTIIIMKYICQYSYKL